MVVENTFMKLFCRAAASSNQSLGASARPNMLSARHGSSVAQTQELNATSTSNRFAERKQCPFPRRP